MGMREKIVFGIFGLLLALCVILPGAAMSQTSTADAAAELRKGKRLYNRCVPCHKQDGSGGPSYGGYAANLRDTQLNHEEIVAVITNGRRNKGMPTFKPILSKGEIETMAKFIQTQFKAEP
jgi:mono/diheme cytochrome c family protein